MDLRADVATLTAALVDIASVSGQERALADAVETALRRCSDLAVVRDGDAVVARSGGQGARVVLAGHLDTVPEAANLPGVRADGRIAGLGACDMKGGVAVALRLMAQAARVGRPLTGVFYDGEEVDDARNGLRRLLATHPDWLDGEFAVLLEPTDGVPEAGCQGSLRAEVTVTGVRAHTARAWTGSNAIHAAAGVLDRLAGYVPREPVVEGLSFHEGLQAVRISGGVAGNVVPDHAVVTVNHRFAPDRDVEAATAHLREVFTGYDVAVVDASPGAPPGLDVPAVAAFAAALGGQVRAKLGWTDVARFAARGVPALNFGPGDPLLAHTAGEWVAEASLRDVEDRLRAALAAG